MNYYQDYADKAFQKKKKRYQNETQTFQMYLTSQFNDDVFNNRIDLLNLSNTSIIYNIF